ncbi:MAG: hypothetical protein ABEK36_00525 [Candidatus Aenigmatarchaeota archaeon]
MKTNRNSGETVTNTNEMNFDKEIKLKEVNPTQPDDGNFSPDSGPIEVYLEDKEWYILNGNHRYYKNLETLGPEEIVPVKIVENPYKKY